MGGPKACWLVKEEFGEGREEKEKGEKKYKYIMERNRWVQLFSMVREPPHWGGQTIGELLVLCPLEER